MTKRTEREQRIEQVYAEICNRINGHNADWAEVVRQNQAGWTVEVFDSPTGPKCHTETGIVLSDEDLHRAWLLAQ